VTQQEVLVEHYTMEGWYRLHELPVLSDLRLSGRNFGDDVCKVGTRDKVRQGEVFGLVVRPWECGRYAPGPQEQGGVVGRGF
jgi:hypothetical protein